MRVSMSMRRISPFLAALALSAGAAQAAQVSVQITNEQDPDGLFLTPLLSIFHDGTYDTFDSGGSATTGLENIAEEGAAGDAIGEADAFDSDIVTGVITSPGGFGPAPVIDPGETASLIFDLDTSDNRYFSYLSMVIPSNDFFIGNDDSMAFEVFDALGDFVGGTISIYLADVWDAGTEVNNNQGAAFNAATGGATSTDQNGIIALASSLTSDENLFALTGQPTAAGTTLNFGQNSGALLATITISEVPLPAALPLLLLGVGGLGVMGRRRKA